MPVPCPIQVLKILTNRTLTPHNMLERNSSPSTDMVFFTEISYMENFENLLEKNNPSQDVNFEKISEEISKNIISGGDIKLLW